MNEILDLIPERYRVWILVFVAFSPYLTRGVHALRTGGGIKGMLCGIWLGTNTPKVIDQASKENPNQGKLPLVLLLVTCLAFTGCSYTRLQRGDATATNVRCLWHTEGFAFTSTTNGEITITLQKSNPDAEAMKAVAEGAAKGAVQGAK